MRQWQCLDNGLRISFAEAAIAFGACLAEEKNRTPRPAPKWQAKNLQPWIQLFQTAAAILAQGHVLDSGRPVLNVPGPAFWFAKG